jgi:DNA (cytosine-5)-methyltransferase 1
LQYVRLLQKLKPEGFLFENVYGITGAQGGEAWRNITEAFGEAGYKISYRILDAADYGVPQHRERMFIVGSRSKTFRFPAPTHGPDAIGELPYYTAGEAIDGLVLSSAENELGLKGRYGHLLGAIPPGLNYSFYTAELGHPEPVFSWRSKFSDFLYKADPATPIRTLKAQGGQYTGPFHWSGRAFGTGELKRLQTFPDEYHIEGNRQTVIHQIGNSVPPQLARVLGLSILSQFFEVELSVDIPTLDPRQPLGFRRRKRERTASYRLKAATAISQAALSPVRALRPRDYRATLSKKFSWTPTVEGRWHIKTTVEKSCWKIYVWDEESKREDRMLITVVPCPAKPWVIPCNRVELYLGSSATTGITAAWKAFETELIRGNLKADLVQLSGYYQYRPAIAMTCERLSEKRWSATWRLLEAVTKGVGVGKTLGTSELAVQWNIAEPLLLKAALSLRALGFEVRNHHTNPQIPSGHFLVPYSFPTLTPSSVQLRKKLC